MASKSGQFGQPKNHGVHEFVANYQGPLIPLKALAPDRIHLVATHRDDKATLALKGSAQSLSLDQSVTPNKVSGEASFFADNGKDILHAAFYGTVPEGMQSAEPQRAFVHVIFTGGTGRFKHATGTGTVEADLFPSRGFSQGKIVGNVILPD